MAYLNGGNHYCVGSDFLLKVFHKFKIAPQRQIYYAEDMRR